jgi:hypothetical protein
MTRFTRSLPLAYSLGLAIASSLLPGAGPAIAAVLEGRVLDQATGKPLPGARVTVVTSGTSQETRADGVFELRGLGAGATAIKVEAPGYLPVVFPRVPLSDERAVRLTARMKPGVVKARETVVATDRPSRLAQVETSRRSVTASEIQRVAGARNDPVLAVTTGAGVNTGGFGGQVIIRGGGNNDNLYFLDGIQIGNPFHFGGLISVFNANTLSKVDLYTGAIPARFGNVKSAVFDIETRPPKTDAFHGVFEGNLLYSEGLIEGPIVPGLSYSLAGRRSYFDLFLNGLIPVFSVFPKFDDYQARVTANLPGGGRLDVVSIGSNDQLALKLPAASGSTNPVRSASNDTGYVSSGLVWSQPLGERASNKLVLNYQEPYQRVEVGNFLKIDSMRYRSTLADDTVWQLDDQHTLRAGVRYDTTNYLEVQKRPDAGGRRIGDLTADEVNSLPTLNTNTTGNQKVYGAYVEDAWRPLESLTLSLGARYDRLDSTNEDHLAPRLGLTWRSDADTTWRLAYGQQYQFPDVNELLPGIGNPSLMAAYTRDVVAGVDRQINDLLQARLEVFDRRFLDLVVTDPVERFTNQGSGRVTGAELTLECQPIAGWSGQMALTYSPSFRTNPKDGEKPFEADTPFIGNLVVSGPTFWDWSPSFRLRYSNGRPYTPVVNRVQLPDGTFQPVRGDLLSRRFPDGILWSARVERPAGLWGREGTFYVEVTQQREVLNVDYGTQYEKLDDPTFNYGIPAIPYFGYRLKF